MAPPSCLGSSLGGPSSARSSPPLSRSFSVFFGCLYLFPFLLKQAHVHILPSPLVCRSCLFDPPLCLLAFRIICLSLVCDLLEFPCTGCFLAFVASINFISCMCLHIGLFRPICSHILMIFPDVCSSALPHPALIPTTSHT
jgi:hypothetical protein